MKMKLIICTFAIGVLSSCARFDISQFEASPPLQYSESLMGAELNLTYICRETLTVKGTIVNNTDKIIFRDSHFYFDFLYEDNWYIVPPNETIFFTLALGHIQIGESQDLLYPLILHYPFLRAELYRIRIYISNSRPFPHRQRRTLVMEFTWD